jgi:hypothetical protein
MRPPFGSHSAVRGKADEARGIDADYEQAPRRIDGINFQPTSDTRCGAERKSRLKNVECVRRASPADLAGESDRAADGSAEGDE